MCLAANDFEVAFAPEPDHAVRSSLRLRNGDTLMKALLRAGCKRSDANAAIAAFSQLYDPRKLRAGQMLTVVLVPDEADRRPILHGITFASAPGRNLEVGRAEGGGFAAREIEVALTRGLAHASGTIKSSLYQAATNAKVPQAIMMEMILAFSFDVDFQREIQRGDSFELGTAVCLPSFGDVEQTGCITEWLGTQCDHDVVATVFTLDANSVRQPPDRRMKEQQGFDHALQHIDHVVVTANVRQLVSQHRFDLIGRKSCRQR